MNDWIFFRLFQADAAKSNRNQYFFIARKHTKSQLLKTSQLLRPKTNVDSMNKTSAKQTSVSSRPTRGPSPFYSKDGLSGSSSRIHMHAPLRIPPSAFEMEKRDGDESEGESGTRPQRHMPFRHRAGPAWADPCGGPSAFGGLEASCSWQRLNWRPQLCAYLLAPRQRVLLVPIAILLFLINGI
ncbi:hypothetical protein BU26DRAFT_507817 [Trematosphaeria pertusa]|uniref:Uncharacterized protein n=1 Tax=Trematosphaeria pertusa TaxID=390896 RepID=A0A6A6I757_9PLEO|nr:uncharacterized protein BU26DRAFT_507817 [Trematosphaeria pertusa]KAF2246201.1 hypothetical protein BU26DRAFT_507817 [Trematosphaeria pertusa]